MLDSLKHHDFKYKMKKEIIKKKVNYSCDKLTSNINTEPIILTTSNLKLPAINESRNNSVISASRLKLTNKFIVSNGNNLNSLSRSSSVSAKLSSYQHQRKMNIDQFIRKKVIEKFDQPLITKYSQKTHSVIDDIKKFFWENYLHGQRLSYIKSTRENDLTNGQLKYNPPKSRMESEFKGEENKFVVLSGLNLNNSYYLRKIKNNYYEKKLWKSLNKSLSEFNLYAEYSPRDYDSSEFNILKSVQADNSNLFTCKFLIYIFVFNNLKLYKKIYSNLSHLLEYKSIFVTQYMFQYVELLQRYPSS